MSTFYNELKLQWSLLFLHFAFRLSQIVVSTAINSYFLKWHSYMTDFFGFENKNLLHPNLESDATYYQYYHYCTQCFSLNTCVKHFLIPAHQTDFSVTSFPSVTVLWSPFLYDETGDVGFHWSPSCCSVHSISHIQYKGMSVTKDCSCVSLHIIFLMPFLSPQSSLLCAG